MLTTFHRPSRARALKAARGLTVLELLGCVTAVLGGMWIGSHYLGVNIEHLAHSALQQSHLLEKVPQPWRPEGPAKCAETKEEKLASLRDELGSLRSEIAALRGGSPASEMPTDAPKIDSAEEHHRAYWRSLNEIVFNEDVLQREAETAIAQENAGKVFALKGRISRLAAKRVEAISNDGVEPMLLNFGRQLAVWYERGGELYEKAVQIHEMPSRSTARAPLTEDWKRAELQHRNEARLLRERAAVVRATMSRQFGAEFPEFAKHGEPAEAPASVTASTEAT